ncbi:DeoR/GlpR family DNA-binding transcription regulator [Nakamurella aerolata]|uniref:DeoR/GlpR transcriptional regulator n=1 Tax=Nakamurella aerolata TaxID=1656892 RepID=A0A849AAK6_9ACTN|nr:DeoR/GlpR family DNA-binding transcription regulator [Nakamurella aerolata]NNG36987.1 DeoR/GlpR transcriptional regulator [Nakamurella aerolata]
MPSVDEFDRAQAILTDLDRFGRVQVADLARRFGVSTVTVRKDLDELERRSALRRVRGGAVSAGGTDEGAFDMRLRHSTNAKRAIAQAVAPLVRHGDVIAMDSSTTCYFLAQELLDRRHLVVVTNGLRVAEMFLERSSAMVLMPGGVLRRSSQSMVGPIGDVLAGRGRIDHGFFGVVGLSPELGLLDMVVEEAQAKSGMVAACNEVYALFDSSKLGRFAPHPFAALDRVTALYTDEGARSAAGQWRERGIRMELVAVPGSAAGTVRAAGGVS